MLNYRRGGHREGTARCWKMESSYMYIPMNIVGLIRRKYEQDVENLRKWDEST